MEKYFEASNLRYKSRHPLFFALKFSSCCKLYYDPECIDDKTNLDFIKNLQEMLNKKSLTFQYKK